MKLLHEIVMFIKGQNRGPDIFGCKYLENC